MPETRLTTLMVVLGAGMVLGAAIGYVIGIANSAQRSVVQSPAFLAANTVPAAAEQWVKTSALPDDVKKRLLTPQDAAESGGVAE